MDHSESRYMNTAVRMDEALLKILQKKDIDDISITEICNAAGVNRSTFYLHYGNVGDLLDETIKLVDERFYEYFSEVSHKFYDNMSSGKSSDLMFITPEYLDPFLKYVSENRAIVENALFRPYNMRSIEQYNELFQNIVDPVMDRFNVPEERRAYKSTYYINGIIAIVRKWIENDFCESVEFIRDTIVECVLMNKMNG